jgi:putative hemolysin
MSAVTWIGVAIFILANALYVAAEFGAVGVRRSRVRRMSDDGHALAKRLLPFVENPAKLDRYVGASQIGITLASLMLGAYAQATISVTLEPYARQWFGLDALAARSAAAIAVLAGLTAVQVVIGELVPKALALQYPTQSALATVLPMLVSIRIFRPIIALLNGTSSLVLRLLGAREQGHRHLHSPEEIELLIAESRDGGLLEPEEHRRLHRALRLGLRTARDLMVPRARLTMLSVETPWQDVLGTVANSPFSRIPVYRGTPDRVIGTLRVKDFVERYISVGAQPLERLIRPVVTLTEDLPADQVVTALRNRRAHQAIVVDSHGQLTGLITIQDVLGELLNVRPAAGATAVRK